MTDHAWLIDDVYVSYGVKAPYDVIFVDYQKTFDKIPRKHMENIYVCG